MKRIKPLVGYAVLFLVFFLLSSYMWSREDDLIFQQGIEQFGSLAAWAGWFSDNWGGRIIPQGILVLILQLPPVVFSLVNALVWVALLIYIKRIFDEHHSFSSAFVYVFVPLLLFLLIPKELLQESAFWKCANVLYLWGSMALLAGLYPLVKEMREERCEVSDYVWAILGIVYVSGFEQGGILLCGIFLMLMIFHLAGKKRIRWQNPALFVLAVALTWYFGTRPGNILRVQEETMLWYPQFDMYSTLDKLMLGIWYVIHYIEQEAMYLVMLLVAVVTWAMRRMRKSGGILMIGAYAMFGYFLLCTLNHIGVNVVGNTIPIFSSVFKLVEIDSVEFGFPAWLAVANIIHFMAYVYLGCCLLLMDPECFRPLGFAFYFGALGSMCMMGFSPTIYASRARPRFMCYLFLICLVLNALSVLISRSEKEEQKVQFDQHAASSDRVLTALRSL